MKNNRFLGQICDRIIIDDLFEVNDMFNESVFMKLN